eukprot:GHVS01064553.1.p1 GENE.GHVS01064553.1~~GHVS01064553.1.p1  ORF type:complete len:222 (-),score=30.45 GHVS01064553.1:281-946(-)
MSLYTLRCLSLLCFVLVAADTQNRESGDTTFYDSVEDVVQTTASDMTAASDMTTASDVTPADDGSVIPTTIEALGGPPASKRALQFGFISDIINASTAPLFGKHNYRCGRSGAWCGSSADCCGALHCRGGQCKTSYSGGWSSGGWSSGGHVDSSCFGEHSRCQNHMQCCGMMMCMSGNCERTHNGYHNSYDNNHSNRNYHNDHSNHNYHNSHSNHNGHHRS